MFNTSLNNIFKYGPTRHYSYLMQRCHLLTLRTYAPRGFSSPFSVPWLLWLKTSNFALSSFNRLFQWINLFLSVENYNIMNIEDLNILQSTHCYLYSQEKCTILLLLLNELFTKSPLVKLQRWHRGLKRSPRRRMVGYLNPSRDRSKSFKQVVTASLPNARQ